MKIFPVLIILLSPICLLLPGCAEKKSHLGQIRERGAIHVVTRSSPTTYQHNDQMVERGLEYELVRLLAASLGIDVKFIPADGRERVTGLLEMVEYGKVLYAVAASNEVAWSRISLPELKTYFMSAANEFGFDWRLLAAISYQESHWKKAARSPTGVRGLMMLTKQTARQVGISDHLGPVLSVHGGARYLTTLIDKIPDRIRQPDRTWFALASYNVGFGHVEDVRVITRKNGGDPDSWADVKKHLPLLTGHKWHSQSRFGYARGQEPVQFVENIRKYYAMLMHLTYGDAGTGHNSGHS